MHLKTIKKILKNPLLFLYYLDKYRIITISDKLYIKLMYQLEFETRLNLKNPKTFNEKLQWLKLYDKNPKYIDLVDKSQVKRIVESIIGDRYIIPTLGVWSQFEKIDFKQLPNEFVLKCTHDSGGVVIVKNKSEFNREAAKKIINKSLRKNFYFLGREWPYKNIEPRIIVEEYIEDSEHSDLMDFKIFCFNGSPKIILVCSNRNGNYKNTDFFDTEWNLMPFTRANHENNSNGIEKPKRLTEMLEIARKLSKDIPFVRVDLYEINGQVYFGELTFYPSAGFEGFNPPEYDRILGDMLELPKEKIVKK